MIRIEGIKLNGRKVPRSQLLSVWRMISKEPFPRIEAFLLDDKDFEYILKLNRCRDDEIREILEWGRILSVKGTDACVFNPEDCSDVDYFILIRKNPYHKMKDILNHELSHIAAGDL